MSRAHQFLQARELAAGAIDQVARLGRAAAISVVAQHIQERLQCPCGRLELMPEDQPAPAQRLVVIVAHGRVIPTGDGRESNGAKREPVVALQVHSKPVSMKVEALAAPFSMR